MSEKKAEKTEENCESSARAVLVVNEAVKPKPAVSTMKEETARWELPRPDSPSKQMRPAEEEWREYHGEAIWQKEKDKKRKNPFDHQAYVRKGMR